MVSNPTKQTDRQTPTAAWKWWHWAISVVLVLHLYSVFIPPFTIATTTPQGSRSELASSLRDSFLSPYIEAAFLDHGYAFFAPDPPRANYLIRYRLEFDDGRPPVERTFPDVERHWPRLLYHRHLMLTSQVNDDINLAPKVGALKWESFKSHLKTKYGAKNVELTGVEHFVPLPNHFKQGMQIRDPRLYRDLSPPSSNEPSTEQLP